MSNPSRLVSGAGTGPRHAWPRRVSLTILIVVGISASRYAYNRLVADRNAVSIRSLALADAAETMPSRASLIVCAFNIAHGRGTNDNNFSSTAARRERLTEIGRLLREHHVDVAVLNEVDFDALWTGGENQAEIVAKAGGFPHVLEQRSFDVALPFVHLRFGNAILSRYPITNGTLVHLPALSNSEKRFAGAKQSCFADITIPNKLTIRVFAVHMDPRDEDLRIRCAEPVLACTRSSPHPFICAGDFNSTRSSFLHPSKSTSGATLMDTLIRAELFQTRPETTPAREQMTYSSFAPRIVIDWILVPSNWQILKHEVIDVRLSDHRPVLMEVQLPVGN